MKVTRLSAIPENSLIRNKFGEVDYCDAYQIKKETERNATEISNEIMKLPNWALILFKFRNLVVGIFGLKTDKNTPKPDTFFTVIEQNDSEIVMGEVDKHLDFKVSVMKNNLENTISLTTIVHFNNAWGRIYFFPVKPFHKILIRALLKRYLKS